MMNEPCTSDEAMNELINLAALIAGNLFGLAIWFGWNWMKEKFDPPENY